MITGAALLFCVYCLCSISWGLTNKICDKYWTLDTGHRTHITLPLLGSLFEFVYFCSYALILCLLDYQQERIAFLRGGIYPINWLIIGCLTN